MDNRFPKHRPLQPHPPNSPQSCNFNKTFGLFLYHQPYTGSRTELAHQLTFKCLLGPCGHLNARTGLTWKWVLNKRCPSTGHQGVTSQPRAGSLSIWKAMTPCENWMSVLGHLQPAKSTNTCTHFINSFRKLHISTSIHRFPESSWPQAENPWAALQGPSASAMDNMLVSNFILLSFWLLWVSPRTFPWKDPLKVTRGFYFPAPRVHFNLTDVHRTLRSTSMDYIYISSLYGIFTNRDHIHWIIK